MILIAPAWLRRAWYADIVNLEENGHWALPARADILPRGPVLHTALQSLGLTAWLLEHRWNTDDTQKDYIQEDLT